MMRDLRFKILDLRIIILVLILVIAAFLRLYQLSQVPPSPSLDEVSIGYNAYSILKTGRDEYGYRLPILLRAYDDWRPAFYVYLVIPFVKILGLNVLAVRLPSVILSLITILTTYYLVNELFIAKQQALLINELIKKNKLVNSLTRNKLIALIASFLLAISPWHIYISRLGHEVNAGLAFLVLGVFFFLKTKLYLAAVFLALSLASYQVEKVILPVFVLVIFILFRKELSTTKKNFFLASCLALLILLPFIKATLAPEALIRFEGTSVFRHQPGLIAKGRIVLTQYLAHFKPGWLFFNSGREAHKVPNLGLLYLWEAPLILLGLYSLGRLKIKSQIKGLILAWFFSAPLAASITTGAPHAMRSYTFLPTWQVFGALGAVFLFEKLGVFRRVGGALLMGIILVSLVSFYRNYFLVFPKEQSDSFQYALSGAIPYVLANGAQYDKIVFSNQDNLYQSYMFFLYHAQYDPFTYQAQGGTVSGGFAETHAFGKYEFRPIDWEKEEKDPNILYVGTPQELPENVLQKFFYLDGEEGVRAAKG